MYKLLKDFFKVILCGSGIGVFIIFLWTPIQFLINILIKLFVVLPMFLFSKFMEATGSKLKKLLVNTNNQIQNELKCKYISGTIILPFIIFWLYCSYALFKELPFSSSAILSNIVIFGSFPINWWIALFIALVQNYSNNLSTPWKAFLSLKQKENHKRGMYTYYCDGYPASADILVDWILAMDDFLIKYPDFPFNQNLKENYKTYVADMQRADIIDEHNMVIKDIKQAYEKFLHKATKGTTEYNDIENWYATLKKSNFKSTTPGFYNADY